MLKPGLAFAALALTLTNAPATAANIVVNGGFEDGYAGWTSSCTRSGQEALPTACGPLVTDDASYGPSPAGGQFVSGVTGDFLSRSVTVTPGTSYNWEVFGAARGNRGNLPIGQAPFFTFALASGGFIVLGSADSFTDTSWQRFGGSFVAPDDVVRITIQYNAQGGKVVLDGVSIEAASIAPPVPEPASWAMLILGFGLTGAVLRRRRAVQGAGSSLITRPALATTASRE